MKATERDDLEQDYSLEDKLNRAATQFEKDVTAYSKGERNYDNEDTQFTDHNEENIEIDQPSFVEEEEEQKRNGQQRRLKRKLQEYALENSRKDQIIYDLQNNLDYRTKQNSATTKAALESKKNMLLHAKEDAFENGDYRNIIEIDNQLNEINIELSNLRNLKNNPNPFPHNPYSHKQELTDDEIKRMEIEATINEFVEENSWYLKNPKLRAEYDELFDDERAKLDLSYNDDRLTDINFYNSIADKIRYRYNAKNSNKNYRPKHAPATRNGNPANNSDYLTEEEKVHALLIEDYGQDGKLRTKEEKYRLYAKNRSKDD